MHKPFESLVELTRLQSEINKLFEQIFGGYESDVSEQIWYPNVDFWEKNTDLYVTVELPGASTEEINISVEGNLLIIQGFKRKDKQRTQNMKILQIEREYGPFYRAIQLHTAVNPKNAIASFKNGLLKIRIPKIEDKRAKKIEIPITE